MGSINRVTLIGNLCAKPESRTLANGQTVCDMRVATNETWKDAQGQRQERAEFHSVVCWGKTAENCAAYLDKGRQVCVEGRLQTRDWLDKETGAKRYKTEIVSTHITFLGGKGGTKEETFQEEQPKPTGSYSPTPVDDSDIPF